MIEIGRENYQLFQHYCNYKEFNKLAIEFFAVIMESTIIYLSLDRFEDKHFSDSSFKRDLLIRIFRALRVSLCFDLDSNEVD